MVQLTGAGHKDIPPDDLDEIILARMVKEAGIHYDRALKFQKG